MARRLEDVAHAQELRALPAGHADPPHQRALDHQQTQAVARVVGVVGGLPHAGVAAHDPRHAEPLGPGPPGALQPLREVGIGAQHRDSLGAPTARARAHVRAASRSFTAGMTCVP